MSQPVYLPLVLLAAVVGMAVAFFVWANRDRPGARPLAVFLAASSLWAVAEGLRLATPGIDSGRLWLQVGLSLSSVVPLAWFLLVAAYTGRERWLRTRRVALLLVEPVAFAALVWTNASHELVWTGLERTFISGFGSVAPAYAPGFWGHQVYSTLLVAAGAALLGRMILSSDSIYRMQGTVLLGAIALPVFANALVIFGYFPAGLDPTAVGYVLSGVVVAVVLLRRTLLSLAPVTRQLGREAVLADLDDPIFTLDERDRIVDANPAAEQLLDGALPDALGRALDDVFPELAAAARSLDDATELRLERGGDIRYYDVRASELYRGYGAFSGRLVSLRDVTERRQREQRLDVLNRLLRHNLRNELNVVRGNVELAKRTADAESIERRLGEAVATVDTIVARSDKVGTLSRTLESDGGGPVDLARLLRGSADIDCEAVTLTLPESLPVAAGPSLSVAFEELVGNAIDHNDGDPAVTVSVDEARSDDEYVVLAVRDNGPGIGDQEWKAVAEGEESPLHHSSGIGLWLVNWVVETSGGSLSFENRADGCTVRVRIPRAPAEALTTEDQP